MKSKTDHIYKNRSLDCDKTALLLIKIQNEYASPGGKLHELVKNVMDLTDMMKNTADLTALARDAGIRIFHYQITFNVYSFNDHNDSIGLLKNYRDSTSFQENSWGSDFPESHRPKLNDYVI